MVFELCQKEDINAVTELDFHIPVFRLTECIERGLVYVLREKGETVGVLRYSLFWQTIPFLDHLYLKEDYRRIGCGTRMMREWEKEMLRCGYKDVMLSTQEDEDAKFFYEKLGYVRVGGFYAPKQDAEELIYSKKLESGI